MFTIDSNSWHARVYRWWYLEKYGKSKSVVQDKFDATGYWAGYVRVEVPTTITQSNLCPYMRAVLFWSWMRFLFLTKLLGVQVVFWIFFGLAASVCLAAIIKAPLVAVAGVLLAGIMIGIAWGFKQLMRKPPKTGTSFPQLVAGYLRSAHDRICPEVRFK